ncbi:MAG: efflux RND transporter permease subunit, partial [Oxalicibacterium faecigallinarum]|uniref:efflux RND transporter permease subunit n=1 Tax=Oxalicibacterium faecigallinarum TaxID=573741 RepID=UPI002808EA2E
LIPLLFMADVVGRMFHEFAVTLAIAIGISLIVSLTLTPMMAARMLKHAPSHGRSAEGGHGPRDWLSSTIDRYAYALDWVLARQSLALLVMAGTLLLTVLLYLAVPKGFFPVQDSGAIQVVTEAPQSISFSAMADRQQALADALLKVDGVVGISSFIGVDGNNATLNSGRMLITLAPHADRSLSAGALIDSLRERAREVSGIAAWFQPVQELGMEDRISRTQYQFTLSSPDRKELSTWTHTMLSALQQRPELTDVAANLQTDGLQAFVEIDRDAASRLGLRVGDVATALQNAFGQRQISTLFTHASQYRVVIETDDAKGGGLRALEGIYVVPSSSVATSGTTAATAANITYGTPVPLTSVARVVERKAPLAIDHQGQFPAVTMSFNLAAGKSLGDAVAAVEATKAEIGLPASVELAFQGAAEAFRSSLSNTLWLILAAVVVMYLVLGMLYESAVHPLTILSTLPSATVGALLALLLMGRPLDLIAVIGIVLLIGLVKKNGIMMVDFALDAQRRLNMTPAEAIRRAALLRFRPILMTTLAALFGAVPLMLASGSGAELRQPLGIVMVGGLIVSQVLTLFTTPVVYLAFDRLGRSRAQSAANQPLRPDE